MPSLQSITDLRGPAGRLEALLNSGLNTAPFSVLLCHPHTPSGGTMHNKVIYHAMKSFTSLGLPVLRFNFRGAGLSDGVYDRGIGERDDSLAALAWLRSHLGLPVLAAGFSFGAAVALEACHDQPGIIGLAALGLPVIVPARDGPPREYHYVFLAHCPLPKLFLLGDHDRFAPRPAIESILAAAASPKFLHFIPHADHFFNDFSPNPPSDPKFGLGTHLPAMQLALRQWLLAAFPQLPPPQSFPAP